MHWTTAGEYPANLKNTAWKIDMFPQKGPFQKDLTGNESSSSPINFEGKFVSFQGVNPIDSDERFRQHSVATHHEKNVFFSQVFWMVMIIAMHGNLDLEFYPLSIKKTYEPCIHLHTLLLTRNWPNCKTAGRQIHVFFFEKSRFPNCVNLLIFLPNNSCTSERRSL